MSPSLIPIILTIVFSVFLAIGFLMGFLKGTVKSIVDVAFAIGSAVLALPVTKILVNLIVRPSTILMVLDILESVLPPEANQYIIMAQEIITNDATRDNVQDIIQLVGAFPVLIISPIIYVLVFSIICVVAFIIAFIVKLLACPKTKSVPLRFAGGGLGIIACAILFSAFVLPVVGYTNMASNTIDYYMEITEESKGEEVAEVAESKSGDEIFDKAVIDNALSSAKKYIDPIKNNPICIVTYGLGGKGIFTSLTTISVDNTKINLQNEISGAVDVFDASLAFINTSPSNYGTEQADAINRVNGSLERSEYLPLVLSKTISYIANEYYQGHSIMGIEKPNLGERYNPTFDKILAVLKNTDSDDIRTDIKTISNIANGALETGLVSNVTSDEIDVWEIGENSEFIEVVLVELYKNSRTYNMVPYLTSALTNYAHEIYDDVNGTDTYPVEFDYTNYNEENLEKEAESIAETIKNIHKFVDSFDFSQEESAKEIVVNSDLNALGEALMAMREGMFTDRMFKIVFHAILYSEKADDTGIVDKDFIERAEKNDSDIVKIFVSRQNVLKLALAIQEKKSKEERTELMHSVVEDILSEDETVSSLISKDNLVSIGMSKNDANSVEAIVNSMIDGAHKCEFTDENEKETEIEKTEKIIDAVSNTIFGEVDGDMFKVGESSSTTDMTAQEFVDQVIASKLSSSMVNNAVVDKNGEIKEDPYGIQDALSDSDTEEIRNALESTYSKDGLTDEERKTLDSLSAIFGIENE